MSPLLSEQSENVDSLLCCPRFLVALLLTSNEHVRGKYISGSRQLLSEYIYGKMQSGTVPTIYALSGVNVGPCSVRCSSVQSGFGFPNNAGNNKRAFSIVWLLHPTQDMQRPPS